MVLCVVYVCIRTCIRYIYRYDVIIVPRYVIETKYVRMCTNPAGSIAAHIMCLSNELCTVPAEVLGLASCDDMTGQSPKLLLHV